MELIFRGKERKAIRKKSSLLRLLVQCTVRWMCVGVSGAGGRGEQRCSSCFAACLGLCPVRSHFYRFLLRRRRRKRDEHFQLDAVADLEGE